ncbi:glutathione S-transferase [Viridothelium virens]|uniref:Glutathione S-transferase n=1 Tax=Viridothelium virens TaxID=1048519 RepID=A0A6A6HEN9_VIRVR|nr:glutathione S-transferase [Viridothelium virens]
MADADGQFRRQISKFRNFVTPDPNSPFPAQPNRYVLYIHYGCPWAHRANIVYSLKGLEPLIQRSIIGSKDDELGWKYDASIPGTDAKDPLYGFTYLRELYFKADPGYAARFTVPMLWDKEKETVVSNESSEIIRMFYSAFDEFLPEEKREVNQPGGGLFPAALKGQIEEMNEWVYDTVNNGVYKTGFANTQSAYEDHLYPLFKSLQRLEDHLREKGTPYLFGEHITEADIRLYPTIVRFDPAYYNIFSCNLKMIRQDFPKLDEWLRRLYWDESGKTNGGAFKKTTNFEAIKGGYASAKKCKVTPAGPDPYILPLKA